MNEDNITKESKAQAIKAPPALKDRYEPIDVVEESKYNLKMQSQLR